jgi:CRP/FNR family cyclic AMP-dependent transcriptional regulator
MRRPNEIEALIAALPGLLPGLARRGTLHTYPRKGVTLINQGDSGDSLYIILEGRLRAYSVNLLSGREVTYAHYGAGEHVGELGLDGGPRSASVETTEPSLCVQVRKPVIEEYIGEFPKFAFELLSVVIRRVRVTTKMAQSLALLDVYQRLKELLESLAVPGADGVPTVAEPLSQSEIAKRIVCTREMVSRVMTELHDYVQLGADGRLRIVRRLPDRR